MKVSLKAVVLKTSRLRETQNFFETKLGMIIKESSPTHFVIFSKGIRVLFIESDKGSEIELYLNQNSGEELIIREDPNEIKIIIS
jgi:catechol-2,3-dioxygenase